MITRIVCLIIGSCVIYTWLWSRLPFLAYMCNARRMYFIQSLEITTLSCVGLLQSLKNTMDMLWENFQWTLPLYMKPISFQSKASFVCSVTTAVFIDFCLKKLNVFSQHIGKRPNKYLNSTEQIPRNWNVDQLFYVYYFLRYYLMMQHQHIVKRVNGTHEWAHRPYQPLSAPYHCCLYKHGRLDERQPPHTTWPVPSCN